MLKRPPSHFCAYLACALLLGGNAFAQGLQETPLPPTSVDTPLPTDSGAPEPAKSTKKRPKSTTAPKVEVQQLGPPKLAAPGSENNLDDPNAPRAAPPSDAQSSRPSVQPGSILQDESTRAPREEYREDSSRDATINVPTMPGAPVPNPAAPSKKRERATAKQPRPNAAAPAMSSEENTSGVVAPSVEPAAGNAASPLPAAEGTSKKRAVAPAKNKPGAMGKNKVPVPPPPVAATPAAEPEVKPMPSAAAPSEPLGASAAQLRKEKEELTQLRSTTLNLIRALVEQGVLSKDKAALMLNERERAQFEEMMAQDAAAAPPPEETTSRRKRSQTVRVPLVPETVKNEIREQVKQEVLAAAKSERWAEPGTLPEWLDRITWEGDLRVRLQANRYDSGNASPQQYNAIELNEIQNTQQNSNQARIRLRLGMLAKVSDTVSVGVRLATGNGISPVTANTDLGDYGRGYQFFVDRAYAKWDPNENWSFSGGRMPNPWFWPTDLVWDEDLNFDGLAGSYKPRLSDSLTGFLTVGAFPLGIGAPNQRTTNPKDKWLYAMQIGGDWRMSSATRWRFGGALYEFRNVEGVPNRNIADQQANDWSAAPFRQKGNSGVDIRFVPGPGATLANIGLASKFRVVNASTEFEFAQLDPFFVRFALDYAKNIGFDRAEILARTGRDLEEKTNAYQMRLTLGADAIRKLHDWQLFGGYRYVQRDAILDAFTDSNFWQGGSNTKGYFIGGFYGLDKNALIRARWLSGDQIDGPPLKIDIMQVDMSARF